MNKTKKIIILVGLITILALPAYHKILGEIPPEWFLNKFADTFLNAIPYGVNISYLIIIALELLGSIAMLIGLFKLLSNKDAIKTLSFGFTTYYILFVILTFGSFLVEDYSNGFKDFIYLVGIMLIEKHIFSKK